ncbi:uncharacterized protein LOC108179569 [Tachysurus ichikawai]
MASLTQRGTSPVSFRHGVRVVCEGRSFMLYASTGQMKCFECGDVEHKKLVCPHKAQVSEGAAGLGNVGEAGQGNGEVAGQGNVGAAGQGNEGTARQGNEGTGRQGIEEAGGQGGVVEQITEEKNLIVSQASFYLISSKKPKWLTFGEIGMKVYGSTLGLNGGFSMTVLKETMQSLQRDIGLSDKRIMDGNDTTQGVGLKKKKDKNSAPCYRNRLKGH